MTQKMRLNKRNIQKIPTPDTGRVYHHDDQLRGFTICATAAGGRIWTLYRRVNGTPVRLSLGRYPDLSPDDARKMCLDKLGQIARGEDPRTRPTRSTITLGDLFAQYMDEHARPMKKSADEDQAVFQRYLEPYANRPLDQFTRQTVRQIHLKMKPTPFAANRMLSLVSKVFRFAAYDAEIFHGENPATGVARYPEKPRTRFLTLDEIPRFYDALRKEKPLFRDFFLMCLYTGARKTDVLKMRGEQVNLDHHLWTIPNPKNGEETIIHLPLRAVEILRAKPRRGWIFPSPGPKSSGGPLKDPKTAWNRIRERSGLHDLRIHDLRRSLGSWQAIQGASLPVIGKSLGHKSLKSTEIYARLCLDPVRDSVNAALVDFNRLTEDPATSDDPMSGERSPAE